MLPSTRGARPEPWVCSPLPSRCWRGSCGPFGRAHGGIWLGGCSSRNTLGAEEKAGLEKDPGIVLILAGQRLSALVVRGTGEVFGHTEASHSSHQQDLPPQPLGMAEKSLQGICSGCRGSPQRYPLATAASATCAGTSAALAVPWAGCSHMGTTTPSSQQDPGSPPSHCQGSLAPLCWEDWDQPSPIPQSQGAQALNLFNLFLKDC